MEFSCKILEKYVRFIYGNLCFPHRHTIITLSFCTGYQNLFSYMWLFCIPSVNKWWYTVMDPVCKGPCCIKSVHQYMPVPKSTMTVHTVKTQIVNAPNKETGSYMYFAYFPLLLLLSSNSCKRCFCLRSSASCQEIIMVSVVSIVDCQHTNAGQ